MQDVSLDLLQDVSMDVLLYRYIIICSSLCSGHPPYGHRAMQASKEQTKEGWGGRDGLIIAICQHMRPSLAYAHSLYTAILLSACLTSQVLSHVPIKLVCHLHCLPATAPPDL